MKFSAEEAFEADDAGEPIMMDAEAAKKLVAEHSCLWSEFLREECNHLPTTQYNAAKVLGWLGY